MKRGRIKVTLYNRTLKEIDMSDFSYISEDIFSNRSDVVKIELPEGVKKIGNNAFENCNNLEEVIFPDSLEEIGQEAFINCVNLKSAVYKKGVKVDPTSFKGWKDKYIRQGCGICRSLFSLSGICGFFSKLKCFLFDKCVAVRYDF